jgi:hypothetical protein
LAKTCIAAGLLFILLWTVPVLSAAEQLYPVGIRQIEFLDGDRHFALVMFTQPTCPMGHRQISTCHSS